LRHSEFSPFFYKPNELVVEARNRICKERSSSEEKTPVVKSTGVTGRSFDGKGHTDSVNDGICRVYRKAILMMSLVWVERGKPAIGNTCAEDPAGAKKIWFRARCGFRFLCVGRTGLQGVIERRPIRGSSFRKWSKNPGRPMG